jgi:hypothetical protein
MIPNLLIYIPSWFAGARQGASASRQNLAIFWQRQDGLHASDGNG